MSRYAEKRRQFSQAKVDRAIICAILDGANRFYMITDAVVQRLAEAIDPIFIDRRLIILRDYGILEYDRNRRRWDVAPIGECFAERRENRARA